MDLVLYRMAHPVTALGPGRRVVLWMAGCGKKCEGCISPEMQDQGAGTPVPAQTMAKRLIELDPTLDGITLSGGEPFDQAAALVEVLRVVRLQRPMWSVLAYSGYTLDEICGNMTGRAELLNMADILIDGRYRREIAPTRPLAGSGNQVIHYLTSRGMAMRAAIEAFPPQELNWGLGKDSLDMLIGVVQEFRRKSVCDAVETRQDGPQGRE